MNQLASLSILSNAPVNYKSAPPEHNIYTFHIFLFRKGLTDREYLLFHRTSQPNHSVSGIWQSITGTLKLDEAWEDAVKREVYEKTHLKISHVNKTDFLDRTLLKPLHKTRGSEPKYAEERIFFAQIESDVLPEIPHEYNAFGWFSYQKALRLLTIDANKKHIEIIEHSGKSPV
jgi:8-oxo-dGTP pyrophosphatase MutT (NUDIX family)